jgi:hypothetical protein
MPFLRKKFPTYHEFAVAELADIYTSTSLDGALQLEVNCLESGLLINDGKGRFTFRPFPRLAQVSPAFGVQFADVDGDGMVDVYLVQNFFGPQRETGRMDGGLSLLLRGQADGSFEPIAPRQSGLVVHQDAKSLGAADLSGDGRLDFVIGVNDDQLLLLENRTTSGRILQVRLQCPRGDHLVTGARVTLTFDDRTRQTAEVYCGESYLTQTTPIITFGLGDRSVANIHVRWSDGKESFRAIDGKLGHQILINRE